MLNPHFVGQIFKHRFYALKGKLGEEIYWTILGPVSQLKEILTTADTSTNTNIHQLVQRNQDKVHVRKLAEQIMNNNLTPSSMTAEISLDENMTKMTHITSVPGLNNLFLIETNDKSIIDDGGHRFKSWTGIQGAFPNVGNEDSIPIILLEKKGVEISQKRFTNLNSVRKIDPSTIRWMNKKDVVSQLSRYLVDNSKHNFEQHIKVEKQGPHGAEDFWYVFAQWYKTVKIAFVPYINKHKAFTLGEDGTKQANIIVEVVDFVMDRIPIFNEWNNLTKQEKEKARNQNAIFMINVHTNLFKAVMEAVDMYPNEWKMRVELLLDFMKDKWDKKDEVWQGSLVLGNIVRTGGNVKLINEFFQYLMGLKKVPRTNTPGYETNALVTLQSYYKKFNRTYPHMPTPLAPYRKQ